VTFQKRTVISSLRFPPDRSSDPTRSVPLRFLVLRGSFWPPPVLFDVPCFKVTVSFSYFAPFFPPFLGRRVTLTRGWRAVFPVSAGVPVDAPEYAVSPLFSRFYSSTFVPLMVPRSLANAPFPLFCLGGGLFLPSTLDGCSSFWVDCPSNLPCITKDCFFPLSSFVMLFFFSLYLSP